MPYIGQQPTSVAFLTDQFSGNASTTAFTLSAAPANTSSVLVAVSGVLQDPSTYAVDGTTLTFSAAPPTGTGNISGLECLIQCYSTNQCGNIYLSHLTTIFF